MGKFSPRIGRIRQKSKIPTRYSSHVCVKGEGRVFQIARDFAPRTFSSFLAASFSPFPAKLDRLVPRARPMTRDVASKVSTNVVTSNFRRRLWEISYGNRVPRWMDTLGEWKTLFGSFWGRYTENWQLFARPTLLEKMSTFWGEKKLFSVFHRYKTLMFTGIEMMDFFGPYNSEKKAVHEFWINRFVLLLSYYEKCWESEMMIF